ncbi:MAG: hypothetical protein ISR65_18830 [Bacteriovoracaceae bacterium]|nr:hypothetical protein [Bacteriovoracaceae bacterium]
MNEQDIDSKVRDYLKSSYRRRRRMDAFRREVQVIKTDIAKLEKVKKPLFPETLSSYVVLFKALKRAMPIM